MSGWYRAVLALVVVAFVGWILGCTGLAHAAVNSPVARIVLQEEAVVTGARITLGDIAEVETEDEALRIQLLAVDLGRAPLSGQTVFLNEPRLRVALRRDRLPEKQMVIEGTAGDTAVRSQQWGPRLDDGYRGGRSLPSTPEGARVGKAVDPLKGRPVILWITYGPVQLEGMGYLETDGQAGEWVQVRWEGAEEPMWGRLVAPDRVEVSLTGIAEEGGQ